MTRQHFEALAREIIKIQDLTARRSAADAVIRACRPFNPAFNSSRFLAACGLPA